MNGLSLLLDERETLEVTGAFASGEEAMEHIPGLRPDVALVDLGLPGISGTELIGRLKKVLPSLEVIVLTVYEDRKHLFPALRAGASGYLLKDSTSEEIVEAIEEIRKGGSPMSPRIARYVIESFHRVVTEKGTGLNLTEREKELLEGIADGLSAKGLAEKFFISPHTVRTHIKNIYGKLHVHSKLEAVMKAKARGVL